MLREEKGFTLIELMVAISLLGIILAVAAPSLSSYLDKRRIIAVGEAVYGQIQTARSEAIARSQKVYVDFSANDTTTWRLGISTNNNCIQNSNCWLVVDDGDGVIHGVTDSDDDGTMDTDTDDLVYYGLSSSDFSDVKLGDGSGGSPNQISFDPVRGTAVGETIYIRYGTTYEMRVIVGATGRIRLCSPSGATHVGGYTTTC